MSESESISNKQIVTSVIFVSIIAIIVIPKSSSAFVCSIFPSEHRPIIKATGDIMVLRGAPMEQARTWSRTRLSQGDTIKFDEVRFRTTVSGLYLARENGVVHGRSYGRVSYLSTNDYYSGSSSKGYSSFHFTKGDTIEYLQDRAEGWEFWRIGGSVICAEYISPRSISLKEIRRPQFELWVRVIGTNDKVLGWYRLEDQRFFPQPVERARFYEWQGTEFLPRVP